ISAAAIGKQHIEDDRLGRAHRCLRQRFLGRRRGLDRVAGSAELQLERTQNLRLVVDNEDTCTAHGTPAGTSTARKASTNVAPRPGADSTHTRPSLTCAKPRAIARPRPEPRWLPPLPCWNGSKIAACSSASIPGPRSTMRTTT